MKCKAYVTARKSGKKLWCEGETTAREFTDAIPPRDRVGYHPGDVESNINLHIFFLFTGVKS